MGKINNLAWSKAEIKTQSYYPVSQSALDIDVILGSPSRDCEGHGICYVSKRNQANRSGCSMAKSTAKITTSGTIQFQFSKSDLKPAQVGKYFRNGAFQVEETFVLPDFMLVWMQRVYAAIEPGIYPVQETEGLLLVEFEF